ncbi:MAG: hypothetical protein GW780_03640 [Candidatus Aenigmarchaeota archaeon]|nr:hypothetical protein [Candidatus Aenigmarchaeota archaeon]NCS71231.1 hypothetical protein [Candidatus Aenigmarchaeota archaeon]
MFRQMLAIIDLIAGLLLITRPEFGFVRIIGLIVLGKGVWSIVTSGLLGYFTDWMGMIDTLAGVGLLVMYGGGSFPLLALLGVVIIFKGLFSMF